MFITLLLAAGTLALEREENAFARLVRGLVSRTASAGREGRRWPRCARPVVCLLMLAGLACSWTSTGAASRCGWWRWPPARWPSPRSGLAIGALTREVRAASLLAFMLALPLAFLALVPSGAVSPALYDVIRAISALFPFKPTLDALDAALNDTGDLAGPLLHLALLFVVFGGSRGWPRAVRAVARPTARRCLDSSRDGLPRHTPAPPAQDRAAARHGARDRAHPRAPGAADVRAARHRERTPIEAMPGVERLSISHAVEEAGEAHALGIPAVLLFGLPGREGRAGLGRLRRRGRRAARGARASRRRTPSSW